VIDQRVRQRLAVAGVVQGVGFRPFVYSLARQLGLSGSVANDSAGVVIELEGTAAALSEFARRLTADAPPLSVIQSVTVAAIEARGGTEFVIGTSTGGAGRTLVSPDVATCDDCLAELADPGDRRYRHPFISCTNCGPRFTFITALPYDRPATTMARFQLCPACATEYADPANRRFHAQTVACRDCGPQLALRQPGRPTLTGAEAMASARSMIMAGAVVAVKGLGGYHLVCDATDESAVGTLRKRKDRGDKPFAIMVRDLSTAGDVVALSGYEQALLTDARRPIVLAARRPGRRRDLADAVAPGSADLGVMLPYTPVHRLLFGLSGDLPGTQMLVVTSGNVAGEPIVTDDEQATVRLASLADAWLAHDRPIHVPCDDSMVRVVVGVQLPVRHSRGYVPLPIALPIDVRPALAIGGDLKNTFATGSGGYGWLSGHVGDMDDLATLQTLDTATQHLELITGVQPEVLVADAHPSFRSAAWARRNADGRELRLVQHHHAHIASAMAENGHDGSDRVIGIAFDGTGYGDDQAVWGGEVLLADYAGYERVGQLAYVALPGGDAGVRNPCRMALSHLRSADIAWDPGLPCVAACSPIERGVLARQLETGVATVPTSSMGRLFDAVSSIADVCHRVAYEAEAAMQFEGLARTKINNCTDPYAFMITDPTGRLVADPAPVLAATVRDVLVGTEPAVIAARFHLAVADLVVELASRVRSTTGLRTVALSGGVFLNALLTRWCCERLEAGGFEVLRHRLVPPSDAGLCLGQLVVGAGKIPDWQQNKRSTSCV